MLWAQIIEKAEKVLDKSWEFGILGFLTIALLFALLYFIYHVVAVIIPDIHNRYDKSSTTRDEREAAERAAIRGEYLARLTDRDKDVAKQREDFLQALKDLVTTNRQMQAEIQAVQVTLRTLADRLGPGRTGTA